MTKRVDLEYFPVSVLLRKDAIKITDYHRQLVACYYSQLHYRFGRERLLRHIAVLRRIVWTRSGKNLVERRCS